MTPEEEIKLKTEKEILHALAAYLLYERREETQLRVAFAALVGERHHHFHDKLNEDTEFTTCGNEICISALKMLQEARKPRIELNEFSLNLIKDYNLKVMRDMQAKVCIAILEEGEVIKLPESKIIRVDGENA